MDPKTRYWMWTTGTFDVTVSVGLNPARTSQSTGALTQTDGDDYAHVYISQVCRMSGHTQLCGIRDFGGDEELTVVEWISGARSVTFKLRTRGGRHMAEGVVYEV